MYLYHLFMDNTSKYIYADVQVYIMSLKLYVYITQLMNYWGDIMRWYYNKETSYTRSDLPNNYIGYWTDNGQYRYLPYFSNHLPTKCYVSV